MGMTVLMSSNKGRDDSLAYCQRDASFSSYLDTAERDYVKILSKSIHSPSPGRGTCDLLPALAATNSTQHPHNKLSIRRNRNRIPPANELGVFGAHRYFNAEISADDNNKKNVTTPTPTSRSRRDYDGGTTPRNRQMRHCRKKGKEDDDVSQRNKSPKSSTSTRSMPLRSPTPSLKSEASTYWNNSLLKSGGSVGLKILSGFQCKGSCFDKKSVDTATTGTHMDLKVQSPKYKPVQVVGNYGQHRKAQGRLLLSGHQVLQVQVADHFAFPIIDTAASKLMMVNSDELAARKSLEVFGKFHQIGGKQDKIATDNHNLERKLSTLAWDAIPNSSLTSPNALLPFSFPIIPNTSKITSSTIQKDHHDELARYSDASSDLFEIEHLSGVGMGVGATTQALSADIMSSGAISGCMNPSGSGTHHCYEPSEASSIEWSVVTATATASYAFSDCDDDHHRIITAPAAALTTKKISIAPQTETSGFFLGCTNHKTVDVVRNNNHHHHHHKTKNNGSNKFHVKGSPDIAPSTPSRRSYALPYAN